MNRITVLLLIALAVAPAALAANGPALTLRGGWFLPSDPDFRTIYGSGAIWGVEGSWLVWSHFEPWICVDLFTKRGHMIPSGEPTRIWLVPVAAGLRYAGRVGPAVLCAGGGLVYHFFKEIAPIGTAIDGALSVTVEAGGRMALSKRWELRLSVRYMRRRLKPQELEFNVGGVGAVLGFGYRFR
jgi:hypothetical protein